MTKETIKTLVEANEKIAAKLAFSEDVAVTAIGVGVAGCRMVEQLESLAISAMTFGTVGFVARDCGDHPTLKATHDMRHVDVTTLTHEDDLAKIEALLQGQSLVWLLAGLGDLKEGALLECVAKVASRLSVRTILLVTIPEHKALARYSNAITTVEALRPYVMGTVEASVERFKPSRVDEPTSGAEAYLVETCLTMTGILDKDNVIDLDVEDIETILSEDPSTAVGSGIGRGDHRVVAAMLMALEGPLLKEAYSGKPRSLLVYVTGKDITLAELREGMRFLKPWPHESAIVIFGSGVNETLDDVAHVTIIVCGYDNRDDPKAKWHQMLWSRHEAHKAADSMSAGAANEGSTESLKAKTDMIVVPVYVSQINDR